MAESRFAMPTSSSASFRVAAVLVPLEHIVTTEWIEAPSGITFVVVQHEPIDTDGIQRAVLRAHPKVTTVPAAA